MEKLKFSEQQIERLKEICKNREEIEIDGITSYGRAFFSLKGRIAFNTKREPAISPYSIAIEFGEKFDDVTKRDAFAVYKLNIESSIGASLIITSIKTKDGKVYGITKEEDIELAKLAREESAENNKYADETPIVRYDAASGELFLSVGEPVCFRNKDGIEVKGVVTELDRADVFGNPLVGIADGNGRYGLVVDEETVVKKLNEKGEWVVKADNNKEPLDFRVCSAANRKHAKIDVHKIEGYDGYMKYGESCNNLCNKNDEFCQ